MFYIYNDHQVSSPFLHHLSGVRYWNGEGPWQNVREASWLRWKRRCVAALSVCIRLWRRSRWCSSIRSFTLGRACSRKHRSSERQSEAEWRRTNGERISCLLLGFAPLLSALRGKQCAVPMSYQYTNTQSRRRRSNLSWLDVSASLVPVSQQTTLTLPGASRDHPTQARRD